MKKNVKIFGGSLVVVAVVIILLFSFGSLSQKDTEAGVDAESVIIIGENCVYYNDVKGNIIKKDTITDSVELFVEKQKLLSSYDNSVLAIKGDKMTVFDDSGVAVDEFDDINTDFAQLTDGYIYYKDIENGTVVAVSRQTKDSSVVLKIAVDKFKVQGNNVIFTTNDKNMIFYYDTDTGLPMGYFGDKQIECFDVDGTKLVYNDLNNSGKVSMMDTASGEDIVIEGVLSKTFVVNDSTLYYIENIENDSKTYELKAIKLS